MQWAWANITSIVRPLDKASHNASNYRQVTCDELRGSEMKFYDHRKPSRIYIYIYIYIGYACTPKCIKGPEPTRHNPWLRAHWILVRPPLVASVVPLGSYWAPECWGRHLWCQSHVSGSPVASIFGTGDQHWVAVFHFFLRFWSTLVWVSGGGHGSPWAPSWAL